ncbi:MAG TPA: choice-of-anchor B family protein [Longimicrobiales bacterium]
MEHLRGIAAALAFAAATAAGAGAQTLTGGSVPAARAGFGLSLALGENELFIGEPNNRTRPGLVHIYRRTSGGWERAAELHATGGEPGDGFGQQIVLDGNALFVGVPARDGNRGTAYVFERRGADWTQVAQLTPGDLDTRGRFGAAIAVNGDVALIAAPGQQNAAGAVYVFSRSGGVWTQSAKLVADSITPRAGFGTAIALAGDVALIGSPGLSENRGRVSVFSRAASGTWMSSGDLDAPGLEPNDRFGWSIRAADGIALVSAPMANGSVGAIYTYAPRADGAWMRRGEVRPETAAPNTAFGMVTSFDGSRLIIGSPPADTGRGAVFVATRTPDGMFSVPRRIMTSDAPARGEQFGGAVAIRGNLAVATISGDDHGLGTVVVFEHTDGTWTESAVLKGEAETLASVRGGEVRCSEQGMAAQFDCRDVEMLSFLSIPDLGGARGVRLNDIWGWTDPQTGKEYALVGRIDGMSAVDVSDPANPVFVADLPLTTGANPAVWRDIKVYRDHAFIVADGAGSHGMQVLDLARLRAFSGSPLQLEPDTVYASINSAHNIVINEESGFAYIVGARQGGETCGGGLHMVDIREPARPAFAGCFADPQTGRASTGYSHDAQCVIYNGPDERYRGREICLGSNETALSIADVTDKENPRALSRASYPNVGYSHQGWLDESHRYFYMNDELDELNGLTTRTRTLVWDLADLEDPQLVTEHAGVEASSDHNLYIRDDLMYQSNYKSGLRILDISDRENPREVAFFKTFPGDDAAAGFAGSWSNYPYFRSGIIVVSSIGEGLFVLKKRDTTTVF